MAKKDEEIDPSKRVATSEVMSKIDSLPTIPIVSLRVGEMVNNPDSSAEDIAAVMRGDPSLSAKVLQLVNSAYYAIPGGVADVQRAISFIGFNTLHQLVLSVSVLRTLQTPAGNNFDAKGLWLHSLGVAACAEVIAQHIGYRDPGECFTAGLLHDVGKIGLAIAAPDRFGVALDEANSHGISMSAAEKSVGLPSHDKVGSRLAKKWRLPSELMMPITHHHASNDPLMRRKLAPKLLSIVDIVAVADELCRYFDIGNSGSPPPDKTSGDLLERLGISRIQEGKIRSELMRKLEISKVFLELIDG